ncbi:DUF4405 domain-containing protein [Colwellia sp. E2M01]|uniref:DUF4405 domain-containing protein n=1 Tax=Colwellia sp. E2M01 TaxID=2841561 RepID=UPI001C095118|nr:DUF4405 domain-containing protein [Colwellia sp. E2M01]MBU2871411.1 DUF4405 domain-containing protein [Colwellia sp. E2M01]
MRDWKNNLQKTRYVMDVLLFVIFLLVSAPQATGVPGHEWLSLFFIVPFVIHLLLHWDWIKQSAKRLFSSISLREKFNTVWNYLLYVIMLLATVSGFLVSVALLPSLSITVDIQDFWSKVHHDFSTLIMPMLGVHLALHWHWIINVSKRMFGKGVTS